MDLTDFSDAEQQRSFEIIPPGTYCRVLMRLKPGGVSLPNHNVPEDEDLFSMSKNSDSDAMLLRYELIVTHGPYYGRKLFDQLVIAGGKRDNSGVSKGWLISRQTLRAMLESARGIDPNDDSQFAKGSRSVSAFRDLDNIEFAVKVGVESDPNYGDRNTVDRILVEGDPEYSAVMDGEDVSADPHARVRVRKQAGTVTAPQAAQPQSSRWAARPAQSAPPVTPAQAPGRPGAEPNWLNKNG